MAKAMQDKVVVVTGAGRGIGRAIALAMAEAGARVVVNDLGTTVTGEGIDLSPAQEVVKEIQSRGGEAISSGESVADWEAAQRIIRSALDSFGRLDAVVNNAGILRDRIFYNMSPEEWRMVLDVHVTGSFYVSRAAAPYFREQGRGVYVHMTSTSGLVGNVGQANYAAAKMGIMGLSKSIALDMSRYHVRSNCISPFAWSRMIGTIPGMSEAEQAKRAESLTPEKIAPMAVFLASDLAQKVTGQVFVVRGNEIFLMSQPRPLRAVHQSEGWTPETIASHFLPAVERQLYPLEVSRDVFSWEPI
jgi:NAD(P)-dependent dehydrogenase (short-subunit alcohol dehydrogenase family)